MALLGAFNPLDGLNVTVFRGSMVAGAIGTVLTAGYLLWMLQRVNLGEPSDEWNEMELHDADGYEFCLLYTSPSPRDMRRSRMPSSA